MLIRLRWKIIAIISGIISLIVSINSYILFDAGESASSSLFFWNTSIRASMREGVVLALISVIVLFISALFTRNQDS